MSRNVCLVVSGFAVLLINSSAIGVVIDPGEILKIDKKKNWIKCINKYEFTREETTV